jgi:hypothetical protein
MYLEKRLIMQFILDYKEDNEFNQQITAIKEELGYEWIGMKNLTEWNNGAPIDLMKKNKILLMTGDS